MSDHTEGVPATELSDDDLERELASLDRTTVDNLHHGSESAVATHQRRLAELLEEAEIRGLHLDVSSGGPDPGVPPESVGIPDYADDDSPRRSPSEPQMPAMPGDAPIGLEEYGTTPAEARRGESLERRLAREEPEFPHLDQEADPRPAEEQAIHQFRPR